MQKIYHYLGSRNLWGNDGFNWSRFQGIEIWQRMSSDDDLTVKQEILHDGNIQQWLERASTRQGEQGCAWVRLFQMVVVGKDAREAPPGLNAECLSRTLDHYGLQLAFNCAMSYPAGLYTPPSQTIDDQAHTYVVSNHPKLAMVWNHGPSYSSKGFDSPGTGHPHTRGICLVGADEFENMHNLLQQPWGTDLTSHPMFPALISSLHLSFRVDTVQQRIKGEVRRVESRTGHHCFKREPDPPALGDLRELSASMSGFATKLAGASRKIKFLDKVHRFIDARADSLGTAAGAELLKHHVGLMESRLEMQLLENEFTRARVDVQLNAIFHLTAQQDTSTGLEISHATQATANIGLQDSASMKVLAIVALIFLPGNFVAALFSTSVFDWDFVTKSRTASITVPVMPQFALFWAITIPLTLLISALVIAWVAFQKRKMFNSMERYKTMS